MFKKMRFFASLVTCICLATGCSTTSIREKVNVPSNTGVAIKSVVIEAFRSPDQAAGKEIRNMIISKLESYGHVMVKSHQAQAILSGELSMSPLETRSWTEKEEETDEKTKEKSITITYYFKAEKTITLHYELLVSGRITADSHSKTYSKEWSGDTYSEAKSKITSDASIISSLLSPLASNVVKDISPHQITMNFDFHHGKKDDNIKLGITYVENRRYDQALSIFKQVTLMSTEQPNRAAALYNMGLIYEIKGNFKDAFDHYTMANQIAPQERDYIQALSRAESRKQLNDQFLKQLGN